MEIKNEEDLKRWLKSQPREAAAAIACRAALRIVPELNGAIGKQILLTFYALSISKTILIGERDNLLNNVAYDAYTFIVGENYTFTNANSATNAAAYSIACSADIAVANADIAAIIAADKAVQNIAAEYAIYDENPLFIPGAIRHALDDFWKNITYDVQFIENRKNRAVQDLMAQPLWQGYVPIWITVEWERMKVGISLTAASEHWEVWTEWYDAILDPATPRPCYSPPNWELERERVLLPDALWKQGPAAVNAEIKKLIEKYRAAGKCPQPEKPSKNTEEEEALRQTPAPYIFDETADGLIVARPYRAAIHDPAFSEALRSEIRNDALALAKLLERKQAPWHVIDTVKELADVLAPPLEDIEPAKLYMALRALEADLDAYDTEQGRMELPEDAFSRLKKLVITTNEFAGQFQAITDMQARARTQAILRAGTDKVAKARVEFIQHIDETELPRVDRESVSIALHAADKEIKEIEQALEHAPTEESRAKINEQLAALLSIDLLTLKNFSGKFLSKADAYLRAAKDDWENGDGKKVKEALLYAAAVATLLTALGLMATLLGTGTFGIVYWRLLKEKAEEIYRELQELDEDEDGDDDDDPASE